MNNEDTITISKKDFEKYFEAYIWLNYLEAAGIDNTDAYCYAQELRAQETGEEE